MVLWIFLVVLLAAVGDAFNVDTNTFVRHRGPRGSMFGFSVAEHSERGSGWVLIGAPEAQTHQAGVDKGGAVYKCDINRDDACYEIPFDRNGNSNDSTGHKIDKKSYQWFGATLNSAGLDGPVVACAPRYVSYAAKYQRRDPVGTCYVARNGFQEILEFAPCRTRNWGYHRQGSCQAGLGAAVAKDGRRLYIGAPGSWYWQGQIYSVNPSVRLPFMPPRYKEYGEGQLYSQSLDSRPAVVSTSESQATDDDSYLGYSVAIGDFSGRGEQGVAVGMPRGAQLLGKVVLYTWDLQNHRNITGEQLGAYFGYCLCSGDIDGDGLDDLIVGAPMYTIPNNKGSYESGRIYVIYQGRSEDRFGLSHYRDGVNSKARFGLSLTSLGDINLDGFGDFAVGAPYDGPNERGAVYIYHGGAEGVMEKFSQAIFAEDVAQTPLNTFGFSVSGGIDLDGNQYTDLVVGAYDADTVIFFKSRPVVKMAASVLFDTTELKLISLDEKNCTLFNRQRVVCTRINYCLKYDGINVDTQIEFNLQFVLDSKKLRNPRMFFLDHEGRNALNHSITLDRGQMYCSAMGVYIVDGVRDKLTPLEVEMKYTMRSEDRNAGSSGSIRNTRAVLTPTLDKNVMNVQRDSIHIQKQCGSDNVCIPDLRMYVTPSVNSYLLGSKARLWFDVLIENRGEDAFEASFSAKLPPGVDYVKVERVSGSPTDIHVQCSPPSSGNNNTLHCDIGNPLPNGTLAHFKVILAPYHKKGMAPSYEFYMDANSTNPELNRTNLDNYKHISIAIWVATNLTLTGTSDPPDLHYNETNFMLENSTHEAEIGPQIVHSYSAINNGPSTIEEAEFYVVWPFETLAGDELIYVLEQPETLGMIQCEKAEHLNDRLVTVFTGKSYLPKSGVTTSGGLTSDNVGVTVEGKEGGSFSKSWNTTRTSSSSSSHSSGSRGGAKVLTEEQKKQIDEEEKKFSIETGDGSFVHKQRAEQAQGGGSSGHWRYQENRQGGAAGSSGGRSSNWSSDGRSSTGQEQQQRGGSSSATDLSNRFNNERVQTGGISTGRHGTEETQWSSQSGGAQSGTAQSASEASRAVTGTATGYQTGHWEASAGGGRVWVSASEAHRQTPSHFDQNWRWTSSTGDGQTGQTAGQTPGTYKHTYTASWNTSQTGSGPAVTHHASSNSSTRTGASGAVIDHKETSTEFFTYDRDGQSGSSIDNRYGDVNERITGSSQSFESRRRIISEGEAGNANAGSANYASGTYVPGSGRRYNAAASGDRRYGGSNSSYSYGAEGSGRHKWSTEETVNKDLMNAGSQSFNRGGYRERTDEEEGRYQAGAGGPDSSTVYRGTSNIQAGNTYVGGAQRPEGFGAVAYGRNNELRTNTIDLGVLPQTGSVDQELRNSAGQGRGGYESESRSRQYSNSYSGGSEGQGSRTSESHSSSRYGQYGQQFATESGRDNVATERPVVANTHFRWDRNARNRRQAEELPVEDPELAKVLACKTLHCARVKCIIGPLKNGEEVLFVLRARVNARTLKKLAGSSQAILSTVAAAKVSRLPDIGKPPARTDIRALEILTTVSVQQPSPPPESVPLWLVVLSAAAGAAILLLLIFALYKCGFFERNRPSEAPERQPLNRNGYGHGDEQL